MIKKLLIAVVLILASVSIQAQIKVVDFQLMEGDQTANTFGTEKFDDNNERAALIKIVTPETGLIFEAGSLGIVGTEFKAGEIWLYVPRRSRKLTITSQKFGKLTEWNYTTSIEGGRTYQMLLDLGVGKYVSITTTPRANSDITIDGEYVGKSPIYNRYMSFGTHTIFAKNERFEGTDTINIVPTDNNTGRYANIKMRNMSDRYGKVTVSVDNNAEIYFENQKVGIGTWSTELREGSYTIETRKADCDSVRTTFQVVAQKQNDIQVAPPTPHMGYLRLVTRPSDVMARYFGSRFLSVEESNPLPIGTYQVEFSKKGYEAQTLDFTVRHNETTTDTITLTPVQYVASNTFYFGLAYTARSLSGITGIMGFVLKNHDLQAHYTLGMANSGPVYCYTAGETNNDYQSTVSFKQSSFGLKYGYQCVLKDKLSKLALTPQIGVCIDRLTSKVEEGTRAYADGAAETCLSVGLKLLYAPTKHVYMFVSPEYNVALQKDENYQKLIDTSSIAAGGFLVHAGLMLNF